MNPYLLEFEIKERRREMLAEAERQRLVYLCNSRFPTKTDKLFLALADLLIGIGENLKRRHAPPQATDAGDYAPSSPGVNTHRGLMVQYPTSEMPI